MDEVILGAAGPPDDKDRSMGLAATALAGRLLGVKSLRIMFSS